MKKTVVHSNVEIRDDGRLYFAGADTVALAEKYGTPLLLTDEDRVRARAREYCGAMKKYFGGGSFPLFASKALSFKEIYRVVADEGMGTDIVSSGELFTALSAGFPPERAFFHGNNKTDFDIEYAIKNRIGYFIVDGAEELERIDEYAGKAGVRQKILLRLTPGIDPHTHKKISTGGVDSKFGSAIETGLAEKITLRAASLKNVELCGFHCHIGSQIFEVEPYIAAAEIMIAFIGKMRRDHGITAKILNLGGGFGVRYVESDPEISITENIKVISEHIKAACAAEGVSVPDILLEPGRSIVADAGMTLYTVGSVKEIPGFKNYVSIDGGMTDNPRYTLYQSAYTLILANRAGEKADFKCTVGGRCCESGDLIQENVALAKPKRGDVLAVLVTGAYNYSMASNYNRVTRPPVVMIKGGKDHLAVRRESFEDLVSCDI
ncbi:MAG: diaminopimelate decarboxylase [Clostridia bacterium]|nr:diaminopimelate decarboxylase [Clostridia bacterium]